MIMSKREPRRGIGQKETREMWDAYYSELNSEASSSEFRVEYDRYTHTHSWENSIRVISEYGVLAPQSNVLEAGCGWGRMILGLSNIHSYIHFEAIDISTHALRLGEENLGCLSRGNTITWSVGNVESLQFASDTFDCVYSARVFQHVQDKSKGLSELVRVLKPGGRLVVFLQNKWNPLNFSYYSNLYSPADIHCWMDPLKSSVTYQVKSMDFFPNQLQFFPRWVRMGIERLLESLPLINRFGGKVLLVATKK